MSRLIICGTGLSLVLQICGCAGREPTRSEVIARDAETTLPGSLEQDPPALPPSFTALRDRARALALRPYVAAEAAAELSPFLRDLDYDDYRSIRYRPERSLWRGEPGRFEVQFFHQGFYFHDPVRIHVVERDGATQRFAFSSELFDYDALRAPASDEPLAFTGLRIHTPLNTEAYRDEALVIQGASYLRAVGRGQVYGLSARGLAIDTGEASGEEFPRFSELHLVRPRADDAFVWVLALLEGPRVSGAYALRLTPGETTTIDVHAEVYLRANVEVLGVAPLTSMFWFGEADERRFGDYRPEVHDSDGLLLWSDNGEVLFRPLRNPERTTVCTFRLDSPRGFGLVQRDRAFESYQDLEARYQARPSAWVEPLRDFGKGSLRLLEIASAEETNDNVAALWVPEEVPKSGLSLDYRLHFGQDLEPVKTLARVSATRIARSAGKRVRFVVDFEGEGLDRPAAQIEGSVTVTGGRLVERHAEPNPFTEGTRLSFEIVPERGDVELRAFLHEGTRALSETWSYLWQDRNSSD